MPSVRLDLDGPVEAGDPGDRDVDMVDAVVGNVDPGRLDGEREVALGLAPLPAANGPVQSH